MVECQKSFFDNGTHIRDSDGLAIPVHELYRTESGGYTGSGRVQWRGMPWEASLVSRQEKLRSGDASPFESGKGFHASLDAWFIIFDCGDYGTL